MDDLNDASLLSAWRAGDQEAFGVLVARYHGLVYAACARQAARSDIDDCVQAVFLVLTRRPAAAARVPCLAAWLQRVASFVCLHSRRASARRHRAEAAAAVQASDMNATTPAADALSHLDECLLRLPEKQRAAVTLQYLAGKTPEEVATCLCISRDNAYQLANRGLAALRTLLARRGIAMGGVALASLLAVEAQAATSTSSAQLIPAITAGIPSSAVKTLASGAMKTMSLTAILPVLTVVAVLVAVGAGVFAFGAETKSILAPGLPPPAPTWAMTTGTDHHGAWADLNVAGVTQRMRWIRPGIFNMGCSATEAQVAHDNRERAYRDAKNLQMFDAQVHVVTLTQGFWLADSTVTQALWQAVMGNNPSAYPNGGEYPVEKVSWEDCSAFFERLGTLKPGLAATFPSEAQWEYACRAGSSAATYAGDMECVGAFHAPVLDAIAWYGGNSGVDETVLHAGDSSKQLEQQYPHTRMAPHPVKRKQPNAWGLYDMLGNVYQWCSDWYGPADKMATTDPVGQPVGSQRVVRGGCFAASPASVRAAFRGAHAPNKSGDSLGVRLCIPVSVLAAPKGIDVTPESKTPQQGF